MLSSSLSKQELSHWIAFNQITHVGPARFALLRNYFPDITTAWHASLSELRATRLPQNVAEAIVKERGSIHPEDEIEKVDRAHLDIITLADDTYPALLREIHNPPPLLYFRGTLADARDDFGIAIVGTRKHTPYGLRATETITRELVAHQCTIVSGLALGIDAIAHRACMSASGRTIAVLANGLESVYPSSHTQLAHDIVESGGMVCSEFPIGTKSFKSNFPQRNRIISGLTRGTLVVEAAAKSGSLITAHSALEQNRDVFAVPGPIYSPVSQGPHALIAQGAALVTSAQDIIAALDIEQAPEVLVSREIIPDDPLHEKIYTLLSTEPCHVDELVVRGNLDATKIHSILVTMVLKGYIKEVGGGHYTRL